MTLIAPIAGGFVCLGPLAATRIQWWMHAHPDVGDVDQAEVCWAGHTLAARDAVRFLWGFWGQEPATC